MEAKSNKSMSFLISIFIFISILSHLSSATDTLSLGQSLSGNQTLVSKEGNFELGFFTPGNSSTYYIGIWYKIIPTRDIIWVANRETPISNTFTSELKISEDGHLILLNQSKIPIWSSNSTLSNSTTGNKLAVLLDTGNLVLRSMSNSSTSTSWQSFDHPTNTWMPGGWLGVNKVTGEFKSLTSWKTPEDPAPGHYAQRMDPAGSNQVVLFYNNSEVYWSSGLWNGQYFGDVPGAAASREKTPFVLSFVDGEVWKNVTYTITDPSVITRTVMDSSGQCKTWQWLNSSSQRYWQQIFAIPVVHCDVPSLCGAFAVCDQKSSSLCSCYTGFQPASPLDWDSGCVRRTHLQCSSTNISNGGEQDVFLEMQNVKLPSNSQGLRVSSSEECKLACVNNCSCTAYAYDTTCSIWQGDLRSLQQLYDGDATVGATLYLRLAVSDLPSSRSSHKWVLAVGLSVGALLVLIFFVILAMIWVLRRRKRGGSFMSGEGSLLSITYIDLQHMTKNFSEKLGGGGFGSVFKGTMPDSTTIIAVKKLEGVSQGEKQFRTEVSTMGSIQHINLLRLRGFCSEGTKRLLVYDYMSGGSLDCYLSPNSQVLLDWSTRYQIILGIARGIAYLHEKCRECIIHCDIKPDNILLDGELCAKVADFGMAKLLGRDFSRVLTTMRGTVGYLAPEWISGLPITPKVDVYSFGMMLFEIVSGQRNSSNNSKSKTFFPLWAAQQVIEGDIRRLLDDRLEGNADMVELMRVGRTACWCIQGQELDRPSMGKVVLILEGVIEVSSPPVPKILELLMQDDQEVSYFYNDPLPITEDKEQSGNSEATVVRSLNDP